MSGEIVFLIVRLHGISALSMRNLRSMTQRRY